MHAQLALSPLFMLRVPAKVVRWLAAALGAIAFALAILNSPQHPDDCHPERGSMERGMFSMTQTVSPTTVNPFNNCPGGPQFNMGDFTSH
jgi:hypothetical protein